jgi:hypothetical protein
LFFLKDSIFLKTLFPLIRCLVKGIFKKIEFFVKISNEKTHDSFMSNLKGETIISAQFWGLLSFFNSSREGSVIYLIFLGVT